MFRKVASYGGVILLTLVLAEVFHPLAAIRSLAQGDCRTFKETGKTVCGKFLTYWEGHGGLAQQGFPLSNSFQEKSDLDGKTYTVQYFERAVFEDHPEDQPPYDVLLSQLGTFQFQRKYPNGDPSPPFATPTTVQAGDFHVLDPAIRIKGAYVIVSGAIRYNGTATLINPEIDVTIVDKAGKEIDTVPCCALVTLVTPGSLIPYRNELTDADGAMDNVHIEVKVAPASASDFNFYTSDWAVSQSQLVLPADNRDFPRLTGMIKHNGSKQTESVNVAAVLYDKDGKILDVANDVYTPQNRAEGATYPFELTFEFAAMASTGVKPDHYDIIVQNDITPGQ